jgi:hypothetical protein
LRRRHLDDRLFGLDRDKRLIGHDMIALGNMPSNELSFLQAFTEIREDKSAHGWLYWYARIRRAAASMRASPGR